MWVLFARAPPPDAAYWPGRRWLAAVDAVAWPATAWSVLSQVPGEGGLVLALAMAPLAWGLRRARYVSRTVRQKSAGNQGKDESKNVPARTWTTEIE